MTDFRALCAELVDKWDDTAGIDDLCEALFPTVEAARALLAQPEPQGPTNERLTWLWNHLQVSRRQLMALRGENCLDDTDYQQFARSVLKQWGRPAIEPVAQPEMVNCHWDGPPPAPHTSVSDWFNEEGSKGILRGLRISPLPSRGGPRQGCQVGGKQ